MTTLGREHLQGREGRWTCNPVVVQPVVVQPAGVQPVDVQPVDVQSGGAAG